MKTNRFMTLVLAAGLFGFGFTGCQPQQQPGDNGQQIAVKSDQAPAGFKQAEGVKGVAPAQPGAQQAAPAAPTRPVISAKGAPNPFGPRIADLPVKGNPNAKITIVEFSDYQCPFCSKAEPIVKQILSAYPNDVRVAFAHMPLGFHPKASPAARAARAAQNQGRFWEMHEKLFGNQQALDPQHFEQYAQDLGLDMNRFRADMDNDATDNFIAQGMADAGKFGIQGTPSFLINGRVFVGAQPFDNFKKVIDEELARADKTAAETGLSGNALYEKLVASAPKPAPEPPAPAPAPEGRMLVDIAGAPVFGDPNAPVTLVEFTDFECPFCSKANATIKELVEKNPGKVKIVFKNYPLPFHQKAGLAHRAAEAAKAQGKFWELYQLIFDNQRAIAKEDLIKYAGQAGLDVARFTADLDNPAFDKQIETDKADGNKVGVRGTPHFFFNGTRFSGAQPLNAFQAALDKELEVAAKYQKQGVPAAELYKTIVEKEPKPAAAPAPAPAPDVPIVLDIAGSPTKGDPKAPVTIFQFSEFQCPFCSKVEPTLDQLMAEYPGKIRIVFKHRPLGFHPNARPAAMAAMAANAQGKFWEMHKLLFADQGNLTRENFEKYAAQLGLNMNKFKADLDKNAYEAQIKADEDAAEKNGIGGTPTFVINGKKFVGAQPLENFKKEIDAALAAKK